MQKTAIIYLHGFNSASLDLNGQLLTTKAKLLVMQKFCTDHAIVFDTANVDYRDFVNIVEDSLFAWNHYLDQGYRVIFMGSSMGGFTSEYLAMKTGGIAIMINPALCPSTLLQHFIGVTANPETGQPYQWDQSHCDQYLPFEHELATSRQVFERIILLDKADELLDAEQTRQKYQDSAQVLMFEGGSHGFEHMREALPVIEQILEG